MIVESKGIVLGENREPTQTVRDPLEDPPTHACFHADGTTSVVYPEGHDPKMLVKLPRGYSEKTHAIDHATRSFVRREQPLPEPASEASLHERVRALEGQMAALTTKGEK